MEIWETISLKYRWGIVSCMFIIMQSTLVITRMKKLDIIYNIYVNSGPKESSKVVKTERICTWFSSNFKIIERFLLFSIDVPAYNNLDFFK